MSTLVIDNFDFTSVPPVNVQLSDPGPKSVVDNGGSGVLGTYRSATVWFLSGQSTAQVSYAVGGSTCSFSFGPNDSQAQLNIMWDANGGGLNLDLSSYQQLWVQVAAVDHPGSPITLTLHSQGQTYSQQQSVTGATTLSFPLSRFLPALSQSSLQHVSAIEMSLDGQTDLDIDLAAVGAK